MTTKAKNAARNRLSASKASSKGQLCIFAKTPLLRGVKTRLEPSIGAKACFNLHKWLVEHRLKTLSRNSVYEIQLYVTGDISDQYWRERSLGLDAPIRLQVGETLGDRMSLAVTENLRDSPWVILIGADCPDLDAGYIQKAAEALASGTDLVLGPAEDGGYVLIGLSVDVPELFADIDWGTGLVLSQTLCVAKKRGLTIDQLDLLRDLDTEQDLAFYSAKFKQLAEFLDSVT